MNFVNNVLASLIGSTAMVGLLYFFYWLAFRRCKTEMEAECWWLLGWNCFRFVIRNIDREDSLIGIRCRAFLREIFPPRPGSSVKSFGDTEIVSSERILLPGGKIFQWCALGLNVRVIV